MEGLHKGYFGAGIDEKVLDVFAGALKSRRISLEQLSQVLRIYRYSLNPETGRHARPLTVQDARKILFRIPWISRPRPGGWFTLMLIF